MEDDDDLPENTDSEYGAFRDINEWISVMHYGDIDEEITPPAFIDWANPIKLMDWTFNTIDYIDAFTVSTMWKEFIATKMNE